MGAAAYKIRTSPLGRINAYSQIGERERDQWLMCMNPAPERIDASDELKTMVKDPLFNVAEAIRNSP